MPTRFLRPLIVGSVAALLGTTLAAVPPVVVTAAPVTTFNPNLLLKGSSSAGEPSIRTDRFGRAYVIGPTGVAGGCKAFRVTYDGSSSKYLGLPDHQAGGGDCDWAIGPQETVSGATSDLLAYSSLTLPNITVGKSDNAGDTFGPPNPAAAQVGGDDRMWMDADPKLNPTTGLATVFMTYHDVSVGNIELSISVDGGQTYLQNNPAITAITNVPVGQWAGALAGNELGNVVAHRDAAGKLTLYTIFQTPDSATDNAAQANVSSNFNRVYEAVGTTTDTTPPVVTWTDYEIWHGPVGARYNRIFPVTSVDSTGHVYAFWSDGYHIDSKTSPDGINWGCPANSTPLSCMPFTQIANPPGYAAIMPWAQAGTSGIVDVVFYGSELGPGMPAAPPDPKNPQDDSRNIWNVYFAQSTDFGGTWTVSKASDHVIHTGPICIDGLACDTSTPRRNRTLLDFFQVSIDPKDGDADISYADDHASPGTAFLYYTKQCTGVSATTGTTLLTPCLAPPPPPTPPQGTTCPGPQILDWAGDAPNNYPGGDAQNMKNLDILNGFFKSSAGSANVDVTLTMNDLEAPPPPINLISALWRVFWTYSGTDYYAEATTSGTGSTATASFVAGPVGNGVQVTGEFNPGGNGTFVIHVPRTVVGTPPDGATLTKTFADTHGSFTVAGMGVYYTAAADRAPDSNYGADYKVAQTCPGGGGGGGGGGTCHEADGTGNVHGKSGGNATFQSDEDGCIDGDPNGEQVSDPGAKEAFRSTEVQSVQFDNALGKMTVYGLGVSNGLPVAFLIVEQAATATTPAFYSINLSDGYALAGNLLAGSIQLH